MSALATDRERRLHAPSFDLRPLSPFERRCLLKHIGDCRELVQLTLLGVATARAPAEREAEIAEVYQALRHAEQLIDRAERLAASHA